MDLSVLIPSRHELWLRHTVADVLTNIRGATDVIVIADGEKPIEALPHHPRLHVAVLPKPIGQRAATNLAARLSTARYVMKLDAHCAVSEGFDVELVATAGDLGPGVTQIPKQHNLHVFDWVCSACGRRVYQGRSRERCAVAPWLKPKDQEAERRALGPGCGAVGTLERVVVWNALRKPMSSWCFDADLVYQPSNDFLRKRPEGRYDIVETMTCLGACWFLERDRFLEWGGLDNRHGHWGQMGVEIAGKSWLSGGRMVCNTRCWFSHLFRTQGADFGFPFPTPDGDTARRYSQNLWRSNAWAGQVRPLRWLLDHFAPVPGWKPETINALPRTLPARSPQPSKGLVYYSHGGDAEILDACRAQLLEATDLPLVSVTLEPLAFGDNIVLNLSPGRLTMLRQILAGLEAFDTDIAFLVEHDCLYSPSHFDFDCPRADIAYYNQHTWRVDAETGRAFYAAVNQVSGLCADRRLLIDHYRRRIAHCERHGQTNERFDRKFGYEPMNTAINRARFGGSVPATWMSKGCNVDIKTAACLTAVKSDRREWFVADTAKRRRIGWRESDDIPGWGRTRGRFREWLRSIQPRDRPSALLADAMKGTEAHA